MKQILAWRQMTSVRRDGFQRFFRYIEPSSAIVEVRFVQSEEWK